MKSEWAQWRDEVEGAPASLSERCWRQVPSLIAVVLFVWAVIEWTGAFR